MGIAEREIVEADLRVGTKATRCDGSHETLHVSICVKLPEWDRAVRAQVERPQPKEALGALVTALEAEGIADRPRPRKDVAI